MRALLLSILCAFAASFGACTKENPGQLASASQIKLCAAGGAQYDAATNACVCPPGQAFDGGHCLEHSATGEQNAAGSPHVELPHTAGAETPAVNPSPSPSPEPEAAKAPEPAPAKDAMSPEFTAKVQAACRRAKGHWVASDAYCHCQRGGVLVGGNCVVLNGEASEYACRAAQAPGQWHLGRCLCPDARVFSPSRGGCVPLFSGDVAVRRRICESSMNHGKWDARNERCTCPEGRVVVGEACERRLSVSSREVCESPSNRGEWDKTHKACDCGPGRIWVDQSCKTQSLIDPKTACESEASAGHWDNAAARCVCPGLTKWRPWLRTCG